MEQHNSVHSRALNLESYSDILAENFVPTAFLTTDSKYLFQQNNEICHVSCAARSRLEANSVKLMDWPAKSPQTS